MLDAVTPRIAEILNDHAGLEGALLPILHAVQAEFGHIPQETVPQIAKALNISRAEVHGVITFYHDFRETPAGRHSVKICRAEACQSCGSEELLAQTEALLGCKLHETSADGRFSLEPAYCLGLCASSPAVQIDDKLYARMNQTRMARLVADIGSAS
jgi:formate dehydrogenase subunit gamma